MPSAINSRVNGERHGDAIHLAADGERWWGEQVGKVMHRVLHQHQAWQPLRPRTAQLEAGRDSVVIEFTVPCPPLSIDTSSLGRQEIATKGGFISLAGFQVRGNEGRSLALTSVEVIAPTQLRIQFNKPLPMGEKCRVNYGHPSAGALGNIAEVRSGPEKTEEIVLRARFADQLKPLTNEGAFFVASITGSNTRVPVRGVSEKNGVTVLSYDPRELRNGTRFEVGQSVIAQRPFSYGNVRDSDSEQSVYTFTDASYGTRVGQPYPLWNWCVLFSDFEVDAP